MASATTKRYAVVTGANKGIGFEICKQLASNGIVVVLTARDEKKGLEALQKLKDSYRLSDEYLIFHQLDVLDPHSVSSLSDFVKSQFPKLDILVNNAGISGVAFNHDTFQRATEHSGGWPDGKQVSWEEISTQNYESAEQCLKTNYYGAKFMVEALFPFLQLSETPRIVNVSSFLGSLEFIPNGWAKELLNDVESLTEDKIDEILKQYLKDYKEGLVETKGIWPTAGLPAYTIAKAAMNAYTRILAKKYPTFCVNSLCPGFCKTDITTNVGLLTAAEGAEHAVRLALLPENGPSGFFFRGKEMSCF